MFASKTVWPGHPGATLAYWQFFLDNRWAAWYNMAVPMSEEGLKQKVQQESEQRSMRYYDEKSGLWYVIYWDEALKCYVSQLESGQHSIMAIEG